MLKLDLHLHTHFSHDSGAPSKSIINRCIKTGLNCIAVTDHNNINGALEVRELAPCILIWYGTITSIKVERGAADRLLLGHGRP